MKITLECIARGAGNQWEAVCLDFDLAVQGRSLEEVTRLLRETIDTYIDDALAQPEHVRSAMLGRRAPFSVRLSWAFRLFFAHTGLAVYPLFAGIGAYKVHLAATPPGVPVVAKSLGFGPTGDASLIRKTPP